MVDGGAGTAEARAAPQGTSRFRDGRKPAQERRSGWSAAAKRKHAAEATKAERRMKREAFLIDFIARFPDGGRVAAPTQYEAQTPSQGTSISLGRVPPISFQVVSGHQAVITVSQGAVMNRAVAEGWVVPSVSTSPL